MNSHRKKISVKKRNIIFLSAVGALLAVAWIFRRKPILYPPLSRGMSVAADTRLINLDARYQDEGESERDVVDQAVMESFICSDPPAY